MKKSLIPLASFVLALVFVLSGAVRADVVLTADMNTSSTELGDSTENYTTGAQDTNFYTITVNPNTGYNTVVYQGVLSGNLNLTLSGSSSDAFALGKPQEYKGNTMVNNGILILAGTSDLSTGSVTLHGGSNLHTGNHSGSAVTLANDFYFGSASVLNPGWNKTLVLTGKLQNEPGVVGKITINSNNGAVRLSPADGQVSITGGITVNGSGYQAIGASTYTGRLHFGTDVTLASKLTVNGYVDLEGHTVSVPDFAAGDAGVVKNSTGTGTFKLSLPENAALSTGAHFTADNNAALVIEKDWTGGTLGLTGSGSGTTTLKASSGNVELGLNGDGSVVKDLDLVTGTEADHVTAKVTGTGAKQVSGSVLMGDYAVFDLNGHDQTVTQFHSSGTQGPQDQRYTTGNTHSSLTNSSETPATLKITGEGSNHVFDGTVSGKVNIDLNLGGWYIFNSPNPDWDGTLKVSGSMVLTDGTAMPGTVILNNSIFHNGAKTTGNYTSAIKLTSAGGSIMAGWGTNMTFNGVISDEQEGTPGKLTIRGDSGTVIFAAKNTYTGGTFLGDTGSNAAKVQLNVDDALPVGGDVTFVSNVASFINLNGHAATLGTLNSEFAASKIQNSASDQAALTVGYGITDAAVTATYTGEFTGSVLLEKVGAGTQILSGKSTTLDAKVTAGVLELAGSSQMLKDVEIAGGTLRTSGSGTLIGGTTTMASGTYDAYGNSPSINPTNVTGGTLTNTNTGQKSVFTLSAAGQTTAVNFAGNSEIRVTGSGNLSLTGDSSANNYTGDIYLENSGLLYLANPKVLGDAVIHLNANMINQSNSPVINNQVVLEGTKNGLRAGYGTDKVVTVNGVISGDYALNLNNGELNAGTITLNGANTYTGGTNLLGSRSNGNGSAVPYVLGNDQALGTGALNVKGKSDVQLNATAGNRTISNPIVLSDGIELTVSRTGTNQALLTSKVSGAGTLVVSDGVTFGGTGSVANLHLAAGSVYEMNLNDLKDAGIHDVLTVTDALTIDPGVTLKFVADAPSDLVGWEFNYLNLTNPHEGWNSNVTFDFSAAGDPDLWLHVMDASGGSLRIDNNAVPEPAAWVLLLLGAFGLMKLRRRRF
ncbi:MAG: PEP-CTERM sorting domain-containing protein [Thermoguttaceae bacterium]|nr:PEP-CTERM sorting domain-containing protein [Thermoguttaceae bacterium]